jgi:uncharacterized protein (TIGR02996 family)
MSEEDAFLHALAACPTDDFTRLVYADWLDDRGSVQSRYLRMICEMTRLPQDELLGSTLHDEMLALAAVVDPGWEQAVGQRFEVALIEFAPRDRAELIFALTQVLQLDAIAADELLGVAPIALRSPLTYAEAVHLYIDWLRYRPIFRIRPVVVVRPIPFPEGGAGGRFDVVLRKLPRDFWPHWPQYKLSVADLFGVGTREAADRVRYLPAVLFRAVEWEALEPTLRRIRRAFNEWGAELLPPDALSVVPHTPEGRT